MLKGTHAHQLCVVLCINTNYDNIKMDHRELIVSQNGDSWCLLQAWGFVSSQFQIWTVAFWFQEAEMDTSGVCMQIQLPRCAWGTTEPQGGVHATAHHPAVRHSVSTLLPLYGIFVSFILCGETWLQGGCRHREQVHLDCDTKLWRPATLHHVRHSQGATKWQVGRTQQCILCTPSVEPEIQLNGLKQLL